MNDSEIPKAKLKAALIDQLNAALEVARAAHRSAVEASTHDEARPENDKDTRGLEQSYLARGQAQRVVELETAIALVQQLTTAPCTQVAAGAIVEAVDDDDNRKRFYIAAAGGGLTLLDRVVVLTPSAPIARALWAKKLGDECELSTGAKRRTLTIVAIN